MVSVQGNYKYWMFYISHQGIGSKVVSQQTEMQHAFTFARETIIIFSQIIRADNRSLIIPTMKIVDLRALFGLDPATNGNLAAA